MTTIAEQELALIQGAAANDFPLVKAFADSFSSPTTTIAEAIGLLQAAIANAQDPKTIDDLNGLAANWHEYVGEAGRKYSHVNTATTTTSKTGAGFLHTFCNNTPVASASAVAYDNTAASGTVLFSITLPATLVGGRLETMTMSDPSAPAN